VLREVEAFAATAKSTRKEKREQGSLTPKQMNTWCVYYPD
jgi:hypothetical protein